MIAAAESNGSSQSTIDITFTETNSTLPSSYIRNPQTFFLTNI